MQKSLNLVLLARYEVIFACEVDIWRRHPRLEGIDDKVAGWKPFS